MPIHDANQTTDNRLQNNPEREVTARELKQRLEEELLKPADEIDARLVDSILSELDDYEPDPERQNAGWDAVARKIEAERKKRRLFAMRRVAVAAALVAAFALLSVGTARAFRWSSLLKWLEPLAETFGIYTQTNEPLPTISPADMVIGQTGYAQTMYATLEEMPPRLDGYAAVPGWVPERFAFAKGSVYRDDNMNVVDILFTDGDQWLNFMVSMYHMEDRVVTFEYEKAVGEPSVILCAGREVTVYQNTSDGSLSASWIERDADYAVSGNISQEELVSIINGLSF